MKCLSTWSMERSRILDSREMVIERTDTTDVLHANISLKKTVIVTRLCELQMRKALDDGLSRLVL